MALTLTPEADATVRAHAREGYPYEVVGILAGDRETHRVARAVALRNERADSPQNRYAVNALTLFRAEEALAAEGLDVVGYYHSHPDHPSRYSDFDRDHALPQMSYLIAAVRDGTVASVQSWRLREDRGAMDEELVVVEREQPPTSPEEAPVPVHIQIPTALRSYTDGRSTVEVDGTTAGEALHALTASYPSLSRHLRGDDGALRSFVNVYLNDEDIRFLQKEETALQGGDTLVIVPSIAGGAA